MPTAGYVAPSTLPIPRNANEEWTIEFHGEDGRSACFSFAGLPLPGWHPALAAAFASYVGPAGTRRTHASATGAWVWVRRLLGFLGDLPTCPTGPQELRVVDLDAFVQHVRGSARSPRLAIQTLRAVFRYEPLRSRISGEVADFLDQRVRHERVLDTAGYSDAEFDRILTAARTDVAAIRDRIDAGERLAARYRTDPASLRPDEAALAALLACTTETGVVPKIAGRAAQQRIRRTAVAANLFVTREDREPLLVLLAAVTGRNSETLKELPAEHRILDGVRSSCG